MFAGGIGSPGGLDQVEDLAYAKLPFSLGAYSITIIWLFCHGETSVALGLIVLNVVLLFVPIPGVWLVTGLVISFYYGFKGSRIAVYNKRYKTLDELRKGEQGWTIAGAIFLFLIEIPLAAAVLWELAQIFFSPVPPR